MQCLNSCTDEIWPTTDFVIPLVDESTLRVKGELPKCKHCSALARPNVLMFNDWRYLGIRQEQQRQRFHEWLEEAITRQWKVVIIEIGAGKAVPTVRMTSEEVASSLKGTQLIRINPTVGDDLVPNGHISLLRCGGLRALQLLQQALNQSQS
jgi:NAD-dependent SIR2 family protein deacetylase